jgi:hypothetical protein
MSVVAAGGTPSLTYQWQSSPNGTTWTNISGATGTSYTTPTISTTTQYRVVVSASGNGCGSVNSNAAIVTINPAATVNAGPDQTICAGETVTLNGSISGSGSSGSVTSQVNSSTDDAEENPSGVVDLNSSDLELVEDGSTLQTVGMRFNNLSIPPGATITSAHIQFTVDETSSIGTNLVFRGHDIANAPTFTTTTGNISSRTMTTASASWSPSAWCCSINTKSGGYCSGNCKYKQLDEWKQHGIYCYRFWRACCGSL